MNIDTPIWIYTDGSAVVQAECLGTFAAIVKFPDGRIEFIPGACSWTKTNRMELSAVNQALYWLWEFVWECGRQVAGETTRGIPRVHIFTDSTYVEKGITGENQRNKNRDLWASFDELAWHFQISVQHYGRNLEPAQNQCDSSCLSLRVLFKEWLAAFKAHPKFSNFSMDRKSLVMELPSDFKTHQ